MNTYQADDSSESVNHDEEADCLSCPRDSNNNLVMFAAQTESNVVQGCSACPAGKQASSTECVNCIAGQVSSSATDLECDECKVGQYQNKPGLPSCFECIPGMYSNKNGSSVCDECPAGFSSENPEYNSGIAKQHKISNEAYDVAQLCVFFLMYN